MFAKYYIFILIVVSVYARVADNKKEDWITNLFNTRDDKDNSINENVKPKVLIFKENAVVTNEIHVTDSTVNNNTCVEENNIDSILGPCEPELKVDNGETLILTPLIKEGRIFEARNASKVDSALFLGIKSYAGYLTVNETYKSHSYFWYFPVENKPVNTTPFIIWLQGGPGASSMTGLFDELGPFSVDEHTNLIRNQHTWLRNHSLLFIENPVGTGFSYTEHPDGYAKDMETYSSHLFDALKQFLLIFPELRTSPLFVAGESYAGKYIPAFCMEIHKHKENLGFDVNFKGLIIGNGYIDPIMISNLPKTFYHFGLLDAKQIEIVQPLASSFAQDIADHKSVQAKNKWTTLVAFLLLITNQKQGYNFLKDELVVGKYEPFFARPGVRKAIHVGDTVFSFVNITVNMQLAPEFLSSTTSQLETLLEHYQVLTYCGQLDQLLSCAATSEVYRNLKWSGSQKFSNSSRFPFLYERKTAGYHKSGGGLTEALIRGAGHMAAADSPGPVQHLITLWTHGLPLSPRFHILENGFMSTLVKNSTGSLYI